MPSLDVNQPAIAALITYIPSTLGTAAVVNVGSTMGHIPTVPIPLACMDLSMVAPIVFDPSGKTITVSAATSVAAGSMSAADKAKMDALATVASTGAYSDLSGKPTLGTAAAQNTGFFDASGAAAAAQAASQPLATILTNLAALSGSAGLPRKTGAATWTLDTSTFLTGNQTITLSGDATGSGATTITTTLKNTGTAGTYSSVTTDSQGRVSAGFALSVNNAPSRFIVTTAAAANGWQPSSTQACLVSYSVSISTSATIGGAATGYVVLEICSTNSAVAANWIEIGRVTNSQTITLAIALQSVQVITGTLAGILPTGYFTRLRSVASSGSPTFAWVSGQEALI